MPRIILIILTVIILAALAAWVNQPPQPRPVVVKPANVTPPPIQSQPPPPTGRLCPQGVYIRIGGTEICGVVYSLQRQGNYYVVQLANATVWGQFVLADTGQCLISSVPDGGVRLGCNTYIYVYT